MISDKIKPSKFLLYIVFGFIIVLTSCGVKDEIVYYDNGNPKTVSEIQKGKREGLTTSYYEDGSLAGKIFYINNEVNGRATYYHQNGNISQEVDFVNGQIHGSLIEYSEDNTEKILTSFRNGVPHGEFIKFFPNSDQPAMIGNHEEGKIIGTLSFYDRTGNKLRECYYDDNEINTGCKDF